MKAENRRKSRRDPFSGDHFFVCPGSARGSSLCCPESASIRKYCRRKSKSRQIRGHAAALFSSEHQKIRRADMLV